MLALGLEDKLPNFRIHLSRLDAAIELVLATTRKAYPSLAVPLHSRWRHFAVYGEDRFGAIEQRVRRPERAARARMAFDLVIISVLFDAGAQEQWRYHGAEVQVIRSVAAPCDIGTSVTSTKPKRRKSSRRR